MATGLIVAYPSDLPAPQTAPLSPTERRLVSELRGPMQVRGIQRDFHAVQRLSWVLTAEQGRRFDDWWRDTLLRGGLWFSADWPLLSGRVGNVYRFHRAPTWVYLRGGPKGWGMHRVSAEVEVRGRGEPPRNNYITSVTSRVYPVIAEDDVEIGFALDGINYLQLPLDFMDFSFALTGGSLRNPLITYEWPAEEIDVAFSLEGGDLRAILITYEWPPEALDVAFALLDGDLRVVVVSYLNWPPEAVDVTFSLDGGTLS